MSRTLAEQVVAEVRAELGRQSMTSKDLAKALGVSEMWTSRRLRGLTPFDIADLQRVADVFGVPVSRFVTDAEQAGQTPERAA